MLMLVCKEAVHNYDRPCINDAAGVDHSNAMSHESKVRWSAPPSLFPDQFVEHNPGDCHLTKVSTFFSLRQDTYATKSIASC